LISVDISERALSVRGELVERELKSALLWFDRLTTNGLLMPFKEKSGSKKLQTPQQL
jgi:hypothetical protein